MYNGQQPIFILKEGTTRTSGKTAQSNNIAAAKAVSDAVRSTLGPKGMDKMLVDSMGDVVITNDGATILKEMDIEHPAAKMIIEIAKTQEQHCYDGTTTAVVIAGELLKRSEDLVDQNVHPTVICEGFRLASDKASELIDSHSISVDKAMLYATLVRYARCCAQAAARCCCARRRGGTACASSRRCPAAPTIDPQPAPQTRACPPDACPPTTRGARRRSRRMAYDARRRCSRRNSCATRRARARMPRWSRTRFCFCGPC